MLTSGLLFRIDANKLRRMKFLFTIVIVLIFEPAWSQSPDYYVKAIEKLRTKGKLTAKSSIDKTFVGSVTAYYYNDSLVLISTLTDAEAAGTETLYFLKRKVLTKAFVMESTFNSTDEWTEYFSRHKAADKCYSCHGKMNCIMTEFTFGDKPTVVRTDNKKRIELSLDEKDRMTNELINTCEQLIVLSKELQ